VEPRDDDHHHHHKRDDGKRGDASADPVSDCSDGDYRSVAAAGLCDAERRWNLLEEDQERDPQREALDHRPREDAGIAAQPQTSGDDEEHSREERHDEHP
jgi:hypothetical protein